MSYDYEPTEKKKFKQAPVGVHTGILCVACDIGTHEDTFDGIVSQKHKVYLAWELPDHTTDDGGVKLSVGKEYNLTFGEKSALRKVYIGMTGGTIPDKFGWSHFGALLGKGCNINVGHTLPSPRGAGGNAKVEGVFPLKASEVVPNLSVDPIFFDLRTPDENAMGHLPPFVKDKILASPEYQQFVLNAGKPIEETLNDAIGF